MTDWQGLFILLKFIQHIVSGIGVLIIITGVFYTAYQYLKYVLQGDLCAQGTEINKIRLTLGRVLILGLEFIVAADLIGTTSTPDYYAVGLLAIIVLVRTVLSFSISRELMTLSKE